jgi:hypothetical protein
LERTACGGRGNTDEHEAHWARCRRAPPRPLRMATPFLSRTCVGWI